jgi:uncharacterized protein with von Willebrand factor type A (vWA) domain
VSRALGFLTVLADGLRADGHPVSPAELVDAARALEGLDLDRREGVRLALRATLAKSAVAAKCLDRRFATVFRRPHLPRAGRKGRGGLAGEGREGAAQRLGRGDRGDRGGARSEPPQPGDEIEAAQGDVRTPSPSGRRRPPRPRDALVGLGASSQRDAERAAPPPARHPSQRRRRAELERRGDDALRRRGRRHRRLRTTHHRLAPPAAPSHAGDPRRFDLTGEMSDADERALLRALERSLLSMRLRRAIRRRRARRGELWVQGALRSNLASGGVPFVLARRRRRHRRPRLFVLADVSWSVARGAGLFLQFVLAARRAFSDLRVHLFVDRPVDVTAAIARADRRGPPPLPDDPTGIERLCARHPGLLTEARSDYGTTLYAYQREVGPQLGRNAVLLVYGDARTNWFDPQPWCLEELSDRAGAVVWLVPEPRPRWGTGDSALFAYAPLSDAVYETATLEGLERAFDDLARIGGAAP